MTTPSTSEARAARVLVVDDEPSVRNLLAVALRVAGYDPHLAGSGAEAIALVQQDPDAFDAALIDLNMPDLDGLATIAALRRINSRLRCAIISGDVGLSEDALRAAGAQRLIRKPFSLQSLAVELAALLSP